MPLPSYCMWRQVIFVLVVSRVIGDEAISSVASDNARLKRGTFKVVSSVLGGKENNMKELWRFLKASGQLSMILASEIYSFIRKAPPCKNSSSVLNDVTLALVDYLISLPNPSLDEIEFVHKHLLMAYNDPNERLNFGQASLSKYNIPPSSAAHFERDAALSDKVLQLGTLSVLSKDQWKSDFENLEKHVSNLVGRKISVLSLFLDSPDAVFPVDSSAFLKGYGKKKTLFAPAYPEPPDWDIDMMLKESGKNIAVVNDQAIVYFVAPSAALSVELTVLVCGMVSMPYIANWVVRDGLKFTAEDDTCQSLSNPVSDSKSRYTANFGCSVRAQGAPPAYSGLKAVVGSRCMDFSLKGGNFHIISGFSEIIASKYHRIFLPVFAQRWPSVDQNLDKWYGYRLNVDKGSRQPRISAVASFTSRNKFRYPYLRKKSVPIASPPTYRNFSKLIAARWESNFRRGSEEMMAIVFAPLRFALSGHVATSNERRILSQLAPGSAELKVARPFPKGSCGSLNEKPLHDDENACLGMGCWRSVFVDRNNLVNLMFLTRTQS